MCAATASLTPFRVHGQHHAVRLTFLRAVSLEEVAERPQVRTHQPRARVLGGESDICGDDRAGHLFAVEGGAVEEHRGVALEALALLHERGQRVLPAEGLDAASIRPRDARRHDEGPSDGTVELLDEVAL